MLPSSQRLSRKQVTEFLVNKDIKVVFNTIGTFKYLLKKGGFTVVTGSKQQKKAVLRNKIRRQIYVLFEKYEHNQPVSAILYVSKQAYTMSYNDLKQYLYELLQKIAKNTNKNS
jgi:ribonuclease P protein component